jgi:hypothetical protein
MITIPVARQPKASARTARHRYRRQSQGVIVLFRAILRTSAPKARRGTRMTLKEIQKVRP